jgi:hypothetical protein
MKKGTRPGFEPSFKHAGEEESETWGGGRGNFEFPCARMHGSLGFSLVRRRADLLAE